MSTLSITHRPTSVIAAAAAVAALAAGAVALSVSQQSDHPSAPAQQSQSSVQQTAPRAHHVGPTGSGGHVMVGE